uniref:Uncharacterized protein n=1 Tax=Romanomermis culicivorax TaxID=13658 RepID=A0A915IQB8_ROMCU
MNYAKKAYSQLFEALDLAHKNKGNNINISDYKTSHSFFGFDLTPDEDDNGYWNWIRDGITSIEIEFGDDVPKSGVEIIIYAEFDNLVFITKYCIPAHDYDA